jgi:hypothetical protein
MSKLPGSYPGGPRREDKADLESRGRNLASAEEFDARRGRAASRRWAEKKKRRAWAVLTAAILLAGGTGLFLGFLTHRTTEQLSEEREAERQGGLSDQITSETNRMLMELWRMEDVEFQRNRGTP